MRVVHVATAFPRHGEDPITPWLVELIRRQRAAGLDASVLAPAYRGGPPEESTGIPVDRFRYAPASLEQLTHDETVPDRLRRAPAYGLLVPGYLAAGARAARRLGRLEQPDVVHVHWPMPHAVFGAAMRRGAAGRTAMVCSFYSVEIHWVRARMRPLVPFLRWSARTADAVTAISRSTAAGVRALVERPVAIIPYGAAIEDDGGPPQREPLSGTAAGGGEPPRPVRLLFVGRLVERKGVEVLVRAIAAGGFSRPVELDVVGAGEWEPRIRAVVAETGTGDRVRLLGRVSDEDLRRAYEDCDIFVLPAVRDSKGDTEGLGVVLLEAMRFERPVVASAIGGITDIVEDGVTGLAVPAGDATALAAALRRLIGDPEAARELGRRGRHHAAEAFGWDAVVDRTTEVYREAARARASGP